MIRKLKWRCDDCQDLFENKEALARHFYLYHRLTDIWFNNKRAKIVKRLNPSRRDQYDILLKEFESPGNRLSQNVGIHYGS